jgi:peptide/nickel transport system substrate-binding protein
MSTHYIGFACESIEFQDQRVRKAFAMAVDRRELVEKWLLGEGWPSENGFVPSMDAYNSSNIQAVQFNPKAAQELLAQAGFPSGKGFPQLEFYVNAVKGSASHNLCKGIVAQLKKNLGINLKLVLCSLEERERVVKSGKAKIWRSGWIADYPDPENFLSLFYSGNKANVLTTINDFRFRDKSFDAIYESALRELDEEKRNQLFIECDKIIVNQTPVIPMFTDDYLVMVNIRVRNFETNEMENLDFSTIFIKEPPK